ncbi:MAG: hypothetical protein IJ630_03690, partial [Treponema sp.]|nr:hypothetical protein [Treponema sp.]
ENFLEGATLKEQLEKDIAYAEAAAYEIRIECDDGTGSILTETILSKKVTDKFNIEFKISSGYKFTGWKAYSKSSNGTLTELSSQTISFSSYSTESSDGIYKVTATFAGLAEGIVIKPVCILLPKITEITPAFSNNGIEQNTPIEITFNKSLDSATFTDFSSIILIENETRDLWEFFKTPYFSSSGTKLVIPPNPEKLILSPDGSQNLLEIKVTYDFSKASDIDGLPLDLNGSHSYRINKTFLDQKKVTLTVSSESKYGTFLSAGEKECTVGYTIDLQFTLNKESYIFKGLEAVSTGSGTVLSEEDVLFTILESDDEAGIYKVNVRVLKEINDILIRPKCTLIENAVVTITKSEKGTENISPADGTKVQSFINRSYSVSFSPDDDYEFIRWELYDIKTGSSITNGTYVKLEDPAQPSTNYSVIQVPDTGIELALRPVVVERPQIISNTPQNSGILKDSSIQVLFDHNMDEGSIYYSDDELESLIAKVGEENLLSSDKRDGKYYGYIKDGLTYYKNIVLTNNKTGVNLNDKYEEPFFENDRTLTIPASKKEGKVLDHYTQILVTIEKGFFYKEPIDNITNREVTMPGIKKWAYQVTNKCDEDALVFQQKNGNDVFTLKLNKEAQQSLAVEDKHPEIGNDGNGISDLIFIKSIDEKPTLYCNMALQDVTGGTGPNSTFTVWYERIKIDGSGTGVTGSFTSEYNNTTSEDAIFEGDFDLKLSSGGTYRIWFDFTDRSNNHFIYPTNADKDGSTGFYVTTTDFNISITGTPKMTAFLKDENFDSTGLTMTVSLANSYSWTEDINLYHNFTSSEECFIGKSVTVSYTIAGVTKTADINATYYVAAANALTQEPEKLTNYSGTLSDGVYYKFGDFPQTIASSQNDDDYTSDTVRNGWYLNKTDGYFYAKCVENAFGSNYKYSKGGTVAQLGANSEKYFKVEPIVWRALTANFDHDADGTGDKILLLAETILTAHMPYYDYSDVNRTIGGEDVFPNNYEHSKIRAYLNGLSYEVKAKDSAEQTTDSTYNGKGFLQTAFTSSAQALIADTIVDNSAESTTDAGNRHNQATSYACNDTEDKVFLLSVKEATTEAYGFKAYDVQGNGNSRIRFPTDYAMANYAFSYYYSYNGSNNYGGDWLMRSPYYNNSYNALQISYSGWGYSGNPVYYTNIGIVPALCISAQ